MVPYKYFSALIVTILMPGIAPQAAVDTQSQDQADLIWRNAASGQNSLWHMSAANRSSRASLPGVADPDWQIQGTADFDQDGDRDILFRHISRGENRVWLMAGDTRVASNAITSAHRDWSLMAIGDYDGDGDPDLMWRNTLNGANRYWEMNGQTRLRSVAVRSVAIGGWQMVGTGDLDADGKDDLVWRNPDTSSTRVWLMDGEIRESSGTLPSVAGAWEISGVADFDADGQADLFWHNPESGANSIWLMSGTSRLSRASIATTDLAWQPVGVGDLDGDGKADIVWRNQVNGHNRLWLMDGTLRRSSQAVMTVADQNWEIAALGDVDGPAVAPPGNAWWQPSVNTSWQWQLAGVIDTSFDVAMYDVDLFEVDASMVQTLKGQGRRVICYISVGSWEDWRPDAAQFPPEVIGANYDGWPGEKWLDIRQIEILGPILGARLDMCAAKGFDGIEPDNIDGYTNTTGFPLTYADQLAFNRWLAGEAHARGLSIGLKNDSDQVGDLLTSFDWALTEDCFQQDWCEQMLPFIEMGKPVFAAEYTDTGITSSDFCTKAADWKISALLKNRELDAWVEFCP